jgi:putative transposase
LKRYYGAGNLHFITSSCYRRLPFLGNPRRRTVFRDLLEETRQRYSFVVVGYVVMPEHVHLLIGEPEKGNTVDSDASPKTALCKFCAAGAPTMLAFTSAALGAGS